MIRTRNNDEEPDVIDLTVYHGHHGSLYFPIRPPSPFADHPIQSSLNTNEMATCSSSTKPFEINSRQVDTADTVLSSSSHTTKTWRRTLNKLLKRSKSTKHKQVVSSNTTDLNQPYDFGIGEITRTHSLVLRNTSTNKRVHWIDDDEMILNASHRFIESLKLFVRNIIEDRQPDDDYLKQCHISLNELDSLINCQRIKLAFDHLIQLANNSDKDRLLEQQTYIEELFSQTILFSSA